MAGIEETKEMLEAIFKVSEVILKQFSDGISWHDGIAIANKLRDTEEFGQILYSAYENAEAIPGELKDLDGEETIELIMAVLPFIPRLLNAAKGK